MPATMMTAIRMRMMTRARFLIPCAYARARSKSGRRVPGLPAARPPSCLNHAKSRRFFHIFVIQTVGGERGFLDLAVTDEQDRTPLDEVIERGENFAQIAHPHVQGNESEDGDGGAQDRVVRSDHGFLCGLSDDQQ